MLQNINVPTMFWGSPLWLDIGNYNYLQQSNLGIITTYVKIADKLAPLGIVISHQMSSSTIFRNKKGLHSYQCIFHAFLAPVAIALRASPLSLFCNQHNGSQNPRI